ncbi:MAG: AMP-binding protein [Burkholderiales bacterium]
MSAAFIPLSHLLAQGRVADPAVCLRDGATIPWSTFTAGVGRLAAVVGTHAHRRWLLACEEPLAFATALFAVLHAGRVPVIPPNFQPGTLAALAVEVDAGVTDHTAPAAALHWLPVAAGDGAAVTLAPLPGNAEIVLYTSGSSGAPKAVTKTLAQFDAEVALLERLWGARLADHAVAATVPHHHIYGLLFRLLWPLAAGRPFDDAVCAEPETLAARLQTPVRPVLISSPAFLSRLTDLVLIGQCSPAPVMTFSSGGPLPAVTARAIADGWGEAPTEVYGSTETGGIAWRRQVAAEDGDAWTLLPGVRLRADSDGAHAVHSPQAGTTAQTLADRIALRDDGRFHLQGRLDRVLKVEEKRLSLPEMEAWLEDHPWVREAAATALPVPVRLGAAIVLSTAGAEALRLNDEKTIAAALKDHLLSRFDRVLLPKRWRFPETLPRSDRGKVVAAELVALFGGVTP